jgi:hypothetical protein
MIQPITDKIEVAMAALISGMRTTGGYNFSWSLCDEEDISIGEFPRAVINPTDSLADKETNMDTVAGIGSLDYTNEVLFTILVIGELDTTSTNPNFAIRSNLRKALDDLKMLFGVNYTVNDTCDNILYMGSQIEIIKRNDVQRPGQLRAIFKAIYSQDRSHPSIRAGS